MCALENLRRDSTRVVSWHCGFVRGSCYRRTYKDLGDGDPGVKVEASLMYYSKTVRCF